MPSRLWKTLLVWAVLLTFGLSFGLNYGVYNHAFYLLPAERLLHPELWKNDWAVTQTHHYHLLFAWLAAGILRVDPSGWLMAVVNVLTIAGGMACVWGLLQALTTPGRARLALLVVVLVASGTRTNGPGTSYVFSSVFQPNTLGSVGLLAACWLMLAERPLASGVVLALAGAVHANYLVLCIPVFGVAQLAAGRMARQRASSAMARQRAISTIGLLGRLLRQLGPALLVLLVYLPMIRATSSAAIVAEAQRLYQDVRSPHHYRVETFAHQFLPWAGWQLVGLGTLLATRFEKPSAQRLLALLSGFWAVIVPSLVLASVLVFRPLIQLYPWRITVNCELLAQAAFAAWVIDSVSSAGASPKLGRRALTVVAVGLTLVGIGAVKSGNFLPLVVGLIGFGLILGSPQLLGRPAVMARASSGLAVILGLGLVIANARRFAQLGEKSNLLSGGDPGLQELCRWTASHTGIDDVLLTPPEEENIRFQCRRAIVVDWKTAPMIPGEVLEWYGRVQDVTGRKPLRSAADLKGYAELDRARLQRLRAKYHFDYVVAYRDAQPAIDQEAAFRGQRFVAYRLDREH